MDWGEIAELCRQEWDMLRSDGPSLRTLLHGSSGALSSLLQYEQATTDEVEAAVRHWTTHQAWPALSDIECAMLCLRLEYAGHLAALLAEQPGPSVDAGSEELEGRLEWLLLFAWGEHGWPALQRTLEEFLGTPSGSSGAG